MFADIDDTRLFYERLSRNASPILFFHGGLGLDHTSFRPYLDPLADVAQLNNGRSQHVVCFEEVSHQRFNKDAAMLADALGFDQAFVFGYSYGGFPYFTSFDAEAARRLDSHTRYNAAAANHALGTCLPEFNVVERLSQIEAPTLISPVSIIGSHP